MAQNKTSFSKESDSEVNESKDFIEIIYESINNNETVCKLNNSSHNMNPQKFWRPFETPIETCIEEQCPAQGVGCDGCDAQKLGRQSSQYTFDLNHQNSRPIAYLSADSGQLIISSTIPQHLSANLLVNANERAQPYLSSPKQSRSADRYVPILPELRNYEKRLQLPEMYYQSDRNLLKCQFTNCGKTFRFRSALQNHLLVHSEERKFYCTHCGKRYKQLSGLYSHQSLKHLGKNKKFICNSCGECFVDYRNLRIHEYNQHENDEFVTKALEKPSMGLDFSSDHHSDDSNHSH